MPNRFQRQSMVDLLTRVPVNRGSLLKSIENLLKTIETSENAVMIPTLLKDKVRVDAWELLFVAKILKASILGHGDLVEFYMNHIHQNAAAQQLVEQPPSPSLLARQQSSPAMASPLLTSHNISPKVEHQSPEQQQQQPQQLQANGNLSHSSSGNQKSSNVSWITASQQQSSASLSSGSFSSGGAPSSASSVSSSSSSISANESTPQTTMDIIPEDGQVISVPVVAPPSATPSMTPLKVADDQQAVQETLLATTRPLASARQAQPPSLLQLTTTNNHINSVSELLNYNSPLSPSLDQLTQHLISLQLQQASAAAAALPVSSSTPQTLFEMTSNSKEALSISTNNNNSQHPSNGHAPHDPQHLAPHSANSIPNNSNTLTPATERRHELKSSRSAGCLFRANSGASSPRTPGTPYPQAETLAGAAGANGIVGDPTSLVKLLLQVEQLKTSIVHVNTLLDSVVELYKKSIDNIAQ